MIKLNADSIKEISYDGKKTIIISTKFFDAVVRMAGNEQDIASLINLRESRSLYVTGIVDIEDISVKITGPVPHGISREDFEFMIMNKKIRISTKDIMIHDDFEGIIVDVSLNLSLYVEETEEDIVINKRK